MKKLLLFLIMCVSVFGVYSGDKYSIRNSGPVAFSISDKKKVVFAPGNVQYNKKTKKWRFAPEQWIEFSGGFHNNSFISNNSDWIDWFAWSDSYHKDFGVFVGQRGLSVDLEYQTNLKDFEAKTGVTPKKWFDESHEQQRFYDWGLIFSKDQPSSQWWFTMSMDEFYYLLERKDSRGRTYFCDAIVNGVRGMVIFPDGAVMSGFDIPKLIPETDSSDLSYEYDSDVSFDRINLITVEEWEKLEAEGAVFLPGWDYWTSSSWFGCLACTGSLSPLFFNFFTFWGTCERTCFETASQVRLVREVR